MMQSRATMWLWELPGRDRRAAQRAPSLRPARPRLNPRALCGPGAAASEARGQGRGASPARRCSTAETGRSTGTSRSCCCRTRGAGAGTGSARPRAQDAATVSVRGNMSARTACSDSYRSSHTRNTRRHERGRPWSRGRGPSRHRGERAHPRMQGSHRGSSDRPVDRRRSRMS